jgi:Family of unknown function (DUF6529)
MAPGRLGSAAGPPSAPLLAGQDPEQHRRVAGIDLVGAFLATMLSLTWRGLKRRWAVPVLGGTVFLGLIGVWLTLSVWPFTSKGWHF